MKLPANSALFGPDRTCVPLSARSAPVIPQRPSGHGRPAASPVPPCSAAGRLASTPPRLRRDSGSLAALLRETRPDDPLPSTQPRAWQHRGAHNLPGGGSGGGPMTPRRSFVDVLAVAFQAALRSPIIEFWPTSRPSRTTPTMRPIGRPSRSTLRRCLRMLVRLMSALRS